ncbi:MAG: alpha/beta fold hydrolase [Planctomycetes bacterium]|nr:alpha/beta fold hydrolase [Planctomycetota bacterium]
MIAAAPKATAASRQAAGSQAVLLLHGWLGNPRHCGELAQVLEADGHRVLPVFRHYDSWPCGVTLPDLAVELEAAFRGACRELDRPVTIVAHSMGGLLARQWMRQFYLEAGRRPPVRRLIECASPRHGVPSREWASFLLRHRLFPGAGLGEQLQGPNPFLWELNHAELEHVTRLPETIAVASVTRRRTPLSWLAGGPESDAVVPAVASNPNAIFCRPGAKPRRLAPRPFAVFNGWKHNGRKGVLMHIRANQPLDALTMHVCNAVARPIEDLPPPRDAAPALRRAYLIVKHAPGEEWRLEDRCRETCRAGVSASCRAGSLRPDAARAHAFRAAQRRAACARRGVGHGRGSEGRRGGVRRPVRVALSAA